jgi:hypothetical protein
MLRFDAWKFVNLASTLERASRDAEKFGIDTVIIPQALENFKRYVVGVESIIKPMPELKISLLCLLELKKWLAISQKPKVRDFSQRLGELRRTIERELSTVLFVSISSENQQYYEDPEAFGTEVSEKFPSIRYDIDEAGKCIATDRNTAAVFHLMRVLEIGLNALSAELGVNFENRNWQNIINDIEAEIKKVDGKSGRKNWRDDLQFFSDAATNFRYFKDAWRNYSMHAHDTYSRETAKAIYDRVKGFMQALAQRLGERI